MRSTLREISKDTRINAASYVPMDGINEKVVYICINAINKSGPVDQWEEGKTNIFITSGLREVLNYADRPYTTSRST